MWYLIELVLYHWLVAEVLGQPWMFFAALGIAVLLFILKEITQ